MAHFNVEAHLHRRQGRGKHTKTVWVRRYALVQTAVKRCTEFLMDEGQVGDVIEFVLIKIPGFQLGTLRYTAKGNIDFTWNDTEAKRLKNERLTEFAQPKVYKPSKAQTPARVH